ncbi:aminotransferase class I/II-fold pyridoxal phosphate-dependent enzyme [Nibribacter ruber]|uniref:Aminotransferase n=1 Tax=Nibribacter ruber TaxID=2698458 RepID=A0A6P1P4M2_9BACT|nr:aminotransferase class I/II-fold pyridoxal phosphate-dependent enzyme [Nibribacter ruber]
MISSAHRLQNVPEYYFSRKLAEVRALQAADKHIINLGIGDPDLLPSPETVQGLVQAAVRPEAHHYQPSAGALPLKKAFARWYLKTYGVTLDPKSEVLPLMGSKEGIFHISMAFLNPGDQVLLPDPGYPAYTAVTKLVGAQPVPYALTQENDWQPDLDQLEAVLQGGKVKLMWVNYPHMPTGAGACITMLDALIVLAKKYKFLLVNDNPYSLVLPQESPVSLLSRPGAEKCCLELNSLSKSHNMAGWRVGVVAGNGAYLSCLLQVKSNLDSGMFLPVQQAAIKALHNPETWHDHQNQEYQKRKQVVFELLDLLDCHYQTNTHGLFVWARVPDHVLDTEAFLDELLYEAGIFLTPGKIFGKQGERYLRVSLCSPVSQLKEAIQRIQHHLLPKNTHASI